jgi:hypothetical protein
MAERDGFAINEDLACTRPVRTGEDVEELVLALPFEGDNTNYLTRI